MSVSSVLRRTFVQREEFDPTNPKHIESLSAFVRTGNWGDVQFYSELPYIEAPMTVLMKFAQHTLQIQPESPAERAERLAAKPTLIPFVPGVSHAVDRIERETRMAAANSILEKAMSTA
jgi:hypothetical protein